MLSAGYLSVKCMIYHLIYNLVDIKRSIKLTERIHGRNTVLECRIYRIVPLFARLPDPNECDDRQDGESRSSGTNSTTMAAA